MKTQYKNKTLMERRHSSTYPTKFGEFLRSERAKRGLTSGHIKIRTGVSRTTVLDIENGKVTATLSNMELLLTKGLKLKLSDFARFVEGDL